LAIMDFAFFTAVAVGAEFLVYKYMSSEGRFRVSEAEKSQMSSYVQKINQMNPNELINITREVRDGIAEKCKYKPVRQMLQYTWGLSEEVSDRVAAQYGTRLSAKSKTAIDKYLAIFMDSYSKGQKLETYDSIADLLHELLGKGEDEELDRATLARELSTASESLAKNNPRHLFDTMSRYTQRSFKETDILLFINAVNDIVYRIRSQLFEGPTYYDFLRSISREIRQASKAIARRDSLLLYESYEHVFQEALTRVERIDRFQKTN